MAGPRTSKQNSAQTQSYQHRTETRTNIPTIGIAPDGDIPYMPETKYYYNPHLQPILRFASEGKISLPPRASFLIKEAQKRKLTEDEAWELVDTLLHAQPWLEWANKREEGESFAVDPVPLFIHERLKAEAILKPLNATISNVISLPTRSRHTERPCNSTSTIFRGRTALFWVIAWR